MDKKTFAIGILALMALVLSVAHLIPPQPAFAAEAVSSRDYQLVTARVQQGGEALYLMDNRTGLVAVFTWDNSTRSIQLRAVRPMIELMNE